MSSSRLIFSRIAAAYLLLAVAFTPAFGQGLSAQALSAPLPLDAAIRTGTLPNGLTFFIRRNVEPANRAALRLAVKAGSIDEADDQRGLAHLLEHMAFNGSEHFKAGDLVKYLESIGSRFGPDVNAYTSFDETVYMLEVPTDRPAIIERGFEALSDFAGGIQLDTAEIDKERGVVIEEWRLRQGAQSRMQDAQLQGLFGDSRYVQRLPIGLPEILKSFPAQRIRDFYRDHYRADRMAVIVVGDVDVAATEALIRTHFSGLATRPPAARAVYPVPPHRETRYVTTSDREAQASSVSIVHKRPLQMFRTVGDYRRSLLGALVDQMLNSRLAEIARRPDARFLGASVGGQTLGQTVEGFTVSARTKDGGIAEGLEAIAQEIARVKQHGFGEAELDRAKKGMIAGLERAYNERDKSQSGGFASELIRHFLTGEPAPGIAMELDLARTLLPALTAGDATALAREVLGDESRVVLAVSPEKDGIAPVTQAVLGDALRMGLAAAVEPWRDALDGRALMADLPAPGPVRARREIPEIGVTILTLANGVEVWLKPTDFRNDQVSFTAYARGGVSLAPEADYVNASLSTSIVGLSGIGGINPVDLGKLLAGTIANASTYVSSYTHGISGGSTPRDLETALQLVHLQFTSPNRDPQALDLMKRRLEANLANQAQNPGAVFGERVRRLNTLDHYSARSLKVEDLPGLDADRMHEFYQARFRNAADFTFFFVGAFKVDEIAPLLARYLGSLPSAGKATSAIGANLRLQFPMGVQRETVRKGQEPRSQTSITFFADTGLEEFEVHRVRAATSILQNRLREVLREELGGTYSVGVGYSDTTPQPGYGTTSVSFGSAPENVEKLSGAVMSELDTLRRDGPTDAEVQVVVETERRDLETSLKTNNYWLNSLQTAHLLGRDPRAILQRIARAETLTKANVHEMFKKYFPENRHTVVTLMPEVAPPRAGAQ